MEHLFGLAVVAIAIWTPSAYLRWHVFNLERKIEAMEARLPPSAADAPSSQAQNVP